MPKQLVPTTSAPLTMNELNDLVIRTEQTFKNFSLEAKIIFMRKWLKHDPSLYARIPRDERPIFQSLLREWNGLNSSDFKKVVDRMRHFFQNKIMKKVEMVEGQREKRQFTQQLEDLIQTVTSESCKTPRAVQKVDKMARNAQPVIFNPVMAPRSLQASFNQPQQAPIAVEEAQTAPEQPEQRSWNCTIS